jgi:heme oxygenase (biliverdin-producing, ferredoxin)
VFPELARVAALDADLQFWGGTTASVGAVSCAYARRLEELTDRDPALLVAHAYVRYLGDLSGGQRLARCVATALGSDAGGVAFYRFPIENIDAFKRRYRQALNTLPVDEHTEQRIVREAQDAFARHERLFAELNEGPSPV